MECGVFLLVVSLSAHLAAAAMNAGSLTVANPVSEITMDATPTSMHEGLTKDLILNCNFSTDLSSTFTDLVSLIVNKAGSGIVAYITSASPHQANVQDSLGGGIVTGELVARGDAFISYHWDYPTDQAKGDYSCEAHGIDLFGRPVYATASANISEATVDQDDLLAKIKQLEIAQTDLKSQLQAQLDLHSTQLSNQNNCCQANSDNFNAQLTDQKNQFQAQLDALTAQLTGQKINLQTQLNLHSSQLADQNTIVADLQARLDNARSAMMDIAGDFRGHRYFVSTPMWRDVAVFDSMCGLFGGYLAEIGDQQEYDFVQNLVGNYSVIIGGTDAGHPGRWTYQQSDQPLVFFDWKNGEPNIAHEEQCLIMAEHTTDMKMGDVQCKSEKWNRFLCEVPL